MGALFAFLGLIRWLSLLFWSRWQDITVQGAVLLLCLTYVGLRSWLG